MLVRYAAAQMRAGDKLHAAVAFQSRIEGDPRVVVLKMGEAGAYLATPEARVKISAHAVAAVDATGAGDAFCGSFLARILAGDSPELAARYAVIAAALKCTGYGAVGPIPLAARVWEAMRTIPD